MIFFLYHTSNIAGSHVFSIVIAILPIQSQVIVADLGVNIIITQVLRIIILDVG